MTETPVITKKPQTFKPEDKELKKNNFNRIVRISLIPIALVGLYLAIVFHFLLPYFLLMFFGIVLLKGDFSTSESDSDKEFWGKYFGDIMKLAMGLCLVWISILIWSFVTPYIIIPAALLIWIGLRLYHKYTLRGQVSQLRPGTKLRDLSHIAD